MKGSPQEVYCYYGMITIPFVLRSNLFVEEELQEFQDIKKLQ